MPFLFGRKKLVMNKLILIILIALTGCAQLAHGQLQPVKLQDAKNNIYSTTCSGAAEDWASCFNKASATCASGYVSVDRVESAVGGRREFTFKCKK